MIIYVSTILQYLLTAALGALIGFLGNVWRMHRAEDQLLLCMARADLKAKYDEETARGFTTADDIEVYEPMYRFYHKRGGNGVIERLHKQVSELPIKEV